MRGKKILHILDRFFLPAVLWLFSLFVKHKNSTSKPNKIGLLKLTGIGDLALSTTLLLDVEKEYPEAEIVLYVGKENASLVPLLPSQTLKIVVLDIAQILKNIALIRQEHFDLFIDLGQWTRYEALLAGLSGASRTIGFETEGQNRHYLFSDKIPHQNNMHEYENFQALSRIFTNRPLSLPALHCPTALKRGKLDENLVIFHPWPSGLHPHLKEWPDSYWADLAEKLINQGYKIVISGGPSDRERQDRLLHEFNTRNIEALDLCGQCSLVEFAALLVKTPHNTLVSVNTGIMHMAALLGVQTIALNGPTNPVRWGAIGPRVTNLQPTSQHSVGYLHLGFEYPENAPLIMQDLSVETVFDAITSNHVNQGKSSTK